MEEIVIIEENYTQSSEDLLKSWLKLSKTQSMLHKRKGLNFKKRHELIGLPAVLLPIIYSPISGLLSNVDGIAIANVTVLVTSGILSGVYAFFDLARKSEQHFRYEALYDDLATTIQVELSKQRQFRIKVDRFVEQIQARIDQYKASAPLL